MKKRNMVQTKKYLSEYDSTKKPLQNYKSYIEIKNELIELGVMLEEATIDIKDFKQWIKEFTRLNAMYKNMGDVYIEKCLEHYLSYKLLDFKPSDVFMDVAASGSQYANDLYYSGKVKQTYLLDLAYPEGINGIKIGANAANTKLPDNFVDKIGLHCAYECFEGDADIGFLSEANRLLKQKGRFVITPLYLDKTYFNCSSEKCDQSAIKFDKEALKIWRDDEYQVPFARHYSAKSFYKRVYKNIPNGINAKVVFYKNLPELMSEFKGQRIYCYFLLYGEKK